jgi:hypothetical protein
MKIGQTEIGNKWIIIGSAVLVAIIVFIYLSWPSPKPVNTQQIINDTKAELEKQYTAQLKDKDAQIKDYQSRLVVSEGKYATLVKKYNVLQKEKENVKPPATNAELRDRFTALGYSPLPAK